MDRSPLCRLTIALTAVLTAFAALRVPPASAQINLSQIRPLETVEKPVLIRAEVEPAEAAPGSQVILRVTAEIAPDHYVYSTTQPPGGPTPTTITVDPVPGVASEGAFTTQDAPAVAIEPLFDDLQVEKHHDRVTWTAPFRLADDVAAGPLSLSGTVKYLVCNPRTCTPGSAQFKTSLTVAGASQPPAAVAANSGQSTVVATVYERRAARFRASIEPRAARPGDIVTLSIEAEVASPYHIYAITQPWSPDGAGALPTAIEVTRYGELEPIGNGFEGPPAIRKEIFDMPSQYHEGRVTWSRRFRIPEAASPGVQPMEGAVGYMICTDQACDPPVGFEFRGSVTVADTVDAQPLYFAVKALGNPGAVMQIVERVHAETREGSAELPPVPPTGATPSHQSLAALLLTAIGAAFFALLTPCVFPMIPITVSFFLKQAEKEHHRPIAMALVYCGGIIATFTALGILLSAVFGATALNRLANSGLLNVLIGGVLVFFALNMFGLFEIRLPAGLARMTSQREGQGGYVGVLFMALTFTITSFTCTFAFVGSVLVLAARGDVFFPVVGLLAFSCTFAVPFFFLALFPSLLAKLPKGGGWMNSVKVVMGFVELALCLKFFSVADYIWNPTPVLFAYEFVLAAWVVIGVFTGLYLLGLYRLPHDMPLEHVGVARMVLSMSFLLVATYIGVGLFGTREPGGKLWEWIHAFAPPRVELHGPGALLAEQPGQPVNGPAKVHGGLVYLLDFNRAVDEAKKVNSPLFLDFTGVNCINCRQMEQTVFRDPEVVGRLRNFVRAALYTDRVPGVANELNERLVAQNVKLQVDWFQDVTLPAYAVVTPDLQVLSALKGQQPTKAFREFLELGIEQWQARHGGTDTPRVAITPAPISQAR